MPALRALSGWRRGGDARHPTFSEAAIGALATGLAFIAAAYRERRRQRTQISIWRRSEALGAGRPAAARRES